MTKIAVEQGLRPFQKALETAGFMVVEVQRDEDLKSLRPHAVVISGLDRDFWGSTTGEGCLLLMPRVVHLKKL